MKILGKRLLLAALLASLVITGFGQAQAQDRRLHIVASTTILADVTQRVAGDAASVESLVPLGSNPHSFEVGAQDIVRLSDADAVLVVGMGYEAGLMKVMTEAAGDRVITISACVPVLIVPEGVIVDHGDEEAAHEDEGAHGEALDSASAAICTEDAAAIASGMDLAEPDLALPGTVGALYMVDCGDLRCDPHVWTDPVSLGWWTLAIQRELAALDPANAAIYEANARAYLEELGALHAEIAAQMTAIPAENRQLVTNHVVFNYFAARYGLTPVGVVLPGGSTTAEPSVKDVLALIETIQNLNVSVIFTETVVSDDLARQVADEAGITTIALLTESLDAPGSGADSTLGYLRTNAARIADALVGE